ncbi:MAG: ATP-binding protein, partial [Jatrophihabitantaceae bacterium]
MTTPLIGRGRELGALHSAVAEVAGGVPAAVLLTGLPGVGKTRLAREALRLAAASGFATCAGRAHVLGRDVAYAPIVAALGEAVRDADGQRRAALVGDLPQLGLVLSGLGLADRPAVLDPRRRAADLDAGNLGTGAGRPGHADQRWRAVRDPHP